MEKDELKTQFMMINSKLNDINDRLTTLEKLQEYQNKDLSYHIKRTDILENLVTKFEEKYQNSLKVIADQKHKIHEIMEEANNQQSKKIITFLSFLTPVIYVIYEIVKHVVLD